MKTLIIVTGQISGNHKLASLIYTANSELKKARFNGYNILFKTKGEAVRALSHAYQRLKEDEPIFFKEGGIIYLRGSSLTYDASNARIERHDI